MMNLLSTLQGSLMEGFFPSGWDLEKIGAFANAAGAYLASELMCADAMPTLEILNKFIEQMGSNR